ncbi:MAG: tripartite tricarboxylate transporter family receptor [Hyphomicrobiales bacterium]|nr:tripartite tricarboxylate transporter family receptor [Hyphomicrobiales bacterium]
MTLKSFVLAALLVGAVSASSRARAESVEEFYRGKTITIYIGTGESTNAVDSYARTIGRFIGQYIPGHPTVIVSNMPGAGGIKAANFIYGVAPQDGTVWGFITRGFLLAPLLGIPQVQFDPQELKWIGSPSRTVSVGAVWTQSTDVRTLQDAMKTEVVVGATSPNQDTGVFPVMLNKVIGTKFKVVVGYKSVGEVDLAMRRGELQGKIGFTWNSLNSGQTANWVKDKVVTVLVQLGLEKSPDVPSDIPLALDLARTPEDRAVLQVVCAPSATGYPSFMGPGVPADRLQAIREAYGQVMKDPEFVATLGRQGLDVNPIFAPDLEAIVKQIYTAPKEAVARARALLTDADGGN